MKATDRHRSSFFAALIFILLVLSSGTLSWAADYDSLISQARKQLENDQYTAALATAKAAVIRNPKDYKGHYYAAMANMSLGQLKEAEAEVAIALSQAPKSAKPAVEKLVSAISVGSKKAGQRSSNDIFLICTGVRKASEDGKGYVDNGQFKYIFKIGNNSIHTWNEKKDSWNDDMCTRDFQKCDLNDKLFAVTYEHLDSVKGNFSTSKMIINRKTGHYSETYKFDGGSYKSEDLENGVCAPCSDPSNENGPSKF